MFVLTKPSRLAESFAARRAGGRERGHLGRWAGPSVVTFGWQIKTCKAFEIGQWKTL